MSKEVGEYLDSIRDHLSEQLTRKMQPGERMCIEDLLADTIIIQREHERTGKLECVA